MAIQLTPRIYGQTMQWKIAPANKIDTVTSNPILNTIASDPSKFHTTEALPIWDQNNVRVTLPVAAAIKPMYWRSMRNRHKAFANDYDYAKARTEFIMAHGEKEITLQTPVDGLPSVTLELAGKSYICEHGKKAFDSIPSYDSLSSDNYSLANWIVNNYTSQQEGLVHDYSDGIFSTNPWLSRIIIATQEVNSTDQGVVDDAYIQTRWWEKPYKDFLALHDSTWPDKWTSKANYTYSAANSTYIRQDKNDSYDTGTIYKFKESAMNIYDDQVSYGITLEKIDAYKYKLKYTVPIRFAYAATSIMRSDITSWTKTVDSYAFADFITEVKATFIGKPFNTDDVTVQFSLDSDKQLTTNTKNTNPNKIDKSEFITSESTIDGKLWTEEIARLLLNKYEKGKYIVTCDVPAKWAILNDIHSNSEIQVILQDGTYITRNDSIVTFQVKTITKTFKNTAFTYTLGLMEV